MAAAIGIAFPKDTSVYGYLSEHHSFGEVAKKQGRLHQEDLKKSVELMAEYVAFY